MEPKKLAAMLDLEIN